MPITFAFDALDPATTTECRYWVNELGVTVASPVIIDPAADSHGIGHDAAQYGAVYGAGANLYMVGFAPGVNTPAVVFKSTDNGATWTAVDAAHGPKNPVGQCFDGSNIITVIHASLGGVQPFLFRDFNITTGLWGADYGAGAPILKSDIAFIYKRSNGSILVVSAQGAGGVGTTAILAASWNPGGGVWSVAFDPGNNIALLPGYTGPSIFIAANRITSYQDSNSVVGFFVTLTSGGAFGGRMFFQQINLDNSLGSFFEFPGAATNLGFPNPGGGPPFGVPVLDTVANSIVLPVTPLQSPPNSALLYMSVYVGSPISNPVWTFLAGQGIDPGSRIIDGGDGSLVPQTFAGGATDGINIWFAWQVWDTTSSIPTARTRVSKTSAATPTAGWIPSTIYDMTVAGLPFYPVPVPPAPNQQFISNPTAFFPVSLLPPVPSSGPLAVAYLNIQNINVVYLPIPATVCGTRRKLKPEFQRDKRGIKCRQ